jgi:hypothetical protein
MSFYGSNEIKNLHQQGFRIQLAQSAKEAKYIVSVLIMQQQDALRPFLNLEPDVKLSCPVWDVLAGIWASMVRAMV